MRRVLCSGLLVVSASVHAGPLVSIELTAQAAVETPTVVLGQVARLSSPDLALLRQLVGLPVGTASSSGQPQWLHRVRLQQWVARRAGVPADLIEWSGPAASRVALRNRALDGQTMAAASVETIATRVPPVVSRGDWAWLRSGTGAVTTEARVEVLQDGRPGERIRVRQAGATASLLANVVGPGRLEVAQ